jgi:predicted nucleotidyltransferase
MRKEKATVLSKEEKLKIEEMLRNAVEKHSEVLFAYLHGSFVKDDGFKDIDVAVYVKEIPLSLLQYELSLETELMELIGRHLVDVRILNLSPLSFRFNVIKDGIVLFVRDNDERVEFQETTIRDYLDFAYHRALYVKETLGHGV